jgi:sugar phosphate isomerase/epimerase
MKANSNRMNLSRRDFLAAAAGTAAAVSLTGAVSLGQEQPKADKKPIPVGLQLYSVRQQAAKDMAGTIAAVAKMGYEGVEFAGYGSHKAEDLRKMLDENKIKCCGTHTQWDTLSDANLAATIEFNKILGNKYLIVPMITVRETDAKAAWQKYAEQFNALVEKVKPHGMYVGYHNHDGDLRPLGDTTSLDVLISNTKPDVIMQLDTYWVFAAGADPAVYLKRYPGRTRTTHLKEWTNDKRIAMIGEGDTKWDELFKLYETISNIEWYIIEEERSPTPMEAVDQCLKGYRKLRAQKTA